MLNKKILLSTAIVVLLLPSSVFASSVIRTGEAISVESDQKIEGDFYTMGTVVSVSGEVTEDYLSIAGRNTLNGTVGGDAFIVGATVDIHGPVKEDVRAIGATVIIAEPIAGDVFIFADTVKILSTATIGGDLVIYANTVEISGSVGGNIIGQYNSLRVDAPVGKGIDVKVGALTFGDRADVAEDVVYTSANKLDRAQNTKIAGSVTRSDVAEEKESGRQTPRLLAMAALSVLFAVLAWFLVARRSLSLVVLQARSAGVRPIMIGFVGLLGAPVIIGVLLISVIGTVLGLVGVFAYMLLIMLALLASVATLGTGALQLTKKGKVNEISPFCLVLGVLLVIVLLFVPYLGPVLLLAAFLSAFGALSEVLFRAHVK